MKLTHTLLAALSVSALAAPAFAGSAAPAAMEPMIEAPAPVAMTMGRDWTGGYAGLQLGYADVEASDATGASTSGDDVIGGFTAGYDWDFGNFVLGAGLDADIADLSVGAATLERVYRLKVRGGYDLGNGLLYATAGGAGADVDGLGYDTGYFVGAGYEHMVTDTISLGGEVLYHEFDDFKGTGTDIEATTFQIRANYRF
ncbi:MAG: outer membrane beta-barrel protein [Paracoccaceae bacterium]|uniref:outer membrane protein n=1 Tax=unclassified Seohaeicola TaxID=2641111 RepID=UPI00237B61E4|nr:MULTISPECIES: outer membrane beta-barrel protein [unclassified Seohaeicola]MDD9707893.1 outer membrane beta-barrel protein [Seohaeicola sp. 4SK31]MDD9734889.1 outer membrane beta-barrel protein [Seohaeicola sp. SP36]